MPHIIPRQNKEYSSTVQRKTILEFPLITSSTPLWITFFILLIAKVFFGYGISWMWVTFPLWIIPAIGMVLLFGGVFILGICCLIYFVCTLFSWIYSSLKKQI